MEENFSKWADSLANEGTHGVDAGLPPLGSPYNTVGDNANLSGLEKLILKTIPTENTADFSYNTADVSNRYGKNFKGIDNEELYAQNQGSLEKAYNGVVKMTGVGATTFVNGTAGLVYGVGKWAETGKVSSVWDNPLSNSLNDFNAKWEDKYAHYKTRREIEGSWWEPANLFTGNFLWDGVVKNLGFSLGAMAGGFAWGGLFKAIGLTSKLMSTGVNMASKAEAAIGEATVLSQAERLGSITSKLKNLWGETQPLIGKGLMKTDRAIIATFGSAGEGGIEALNNSQQFRKTMIDEFKATHGYYPETSDMEEINKHAESVGNWSLGLNIALLTGTNYIQLPKIFSSTFKGEKEILNGVAHEAGKYVETLPQKGFGKLLYQAKNVASLFLNPTEGFEEGAQFAVQTGTQEYFGKKYKNQPTSILDDGLLYGVKQALFTDEGTLNIFLGAFSGALQTSGIHSFGKTGLIGERGFTGYGGTEAKFRAEAIDALNKSSIKDKMKEAYTSLKAAEIIQEERKLSVEQGDILESKDLEFDYAHNFIANRLKYNAKGFIDEEVNSLKEEASSDTGFLKLQQEGIAPSTDTKSAFLNRLDALQEHADNAAKLLDTVNLKYKGLVNKEGKPVYTPEVLDKLVYAGAKIMDYNKRIPQLNLPLLSAGINTQEIVDEILQLGTVNTEKATKAKNDIDSLIGLDVDTKEELKTNLRDLMELSLRKKQFINEYEDIKISPFKYTEQKIEDVPVPKEGEDVVEIKTQNKDTEFKIGTEYFIGATVDYDKNGLESPIDIHKFTLLGKNEDGTLKILSNGKVYDVPADKFSKYKLTETAALAKNKTANYFYQHRNDIFSYNFGKKFGGKKLGRIQYEDGKLYFVYKGAKNKIIKKQIDNSHFTPQKGYDYARITNTNKQVQTTEQLNADKEFKEEKDSKNAKEKISENRAKRVEILAELAKEIVEDQATTEENIEKRNAELENIKKELAILEDKILVTENDRDLRFKNKVMFKATTRKMLAAAERLSLMQEKLEKELIDLQNKKEDLDIDLSYIEDAAQYIEELPEYGDDFLDELREQKELMEELIVKTEIEIEGTKGILEKVKSALDSAMSLLTDLVHKFEKKFPNVPLDVMGQTWVNFLQANPNFLKLKPTYKEELKSLEELVAQVEDLDIIPGERTVKELSENINELQNALIEYKKELKAKNAILAKFETIANKYIQEKEEEDKLVRDAQLIKDALGTEDNDTIVQIPFSHKFEAEAKKSDEYVPISTIPLDDTKVPHHVRANKFGILLSKLPNRKQIKGVFITKKNEDALGLKGLMSLLKNDEDSVDESSIIAMVMVEEDKEGKLSLVDENGIKIENTTDYLSKGIFTIMPDKLLTSGKMFRESTSKEVKNSIIDQYKKWREKILKIKDLSEVHEINASLGHAMPVTTTNQNGKEVIDYNARVSVEDSEFVSEEEIEGDLLISIPNLNNTHEKGTTSFPTPLGRIFLELPNGYRKLNNKQHSRAEAESIFDTIMQVAKQMMTVGIKDPESVRLVNFLKSVVYWGIPRDPNTKERKPNGYNSIFWEKDSETGQFLLSISGNGKNYPFTPSSLQLNKEQIITLISNMYNNVNSTLVQDLNSEYEQIISISPSGEIKSVIWPNYQTYLLSNKTPDGKKRTDIPLTTNTRPIVKDVEGDTNITGVYFYTTDTQDDFVIPISEKPKAAPIAKPAAKATAKPISGNFVLDGKTTNTYTSPKTGLSILFGAPANINESNFMKVISVLQGANLDEIFSNVSDRVKEGNPKFTPKQVTEEAQKLIKRTIYDAIVPQLGKKTIEGEDEVFEIPDDENEETVVVNAEKKTEEDEEAFEIPDDEENSDAVNEAINNALKNKNKQKPILREMLEKEIKGNKIENWVELEKWIKENFLNIPLYRVKNIISEIGGNRKAWGMLKDGALYVYEQAEVGTVYHEVFEAVWKLMSSPEEKVSIENEFKNRKGTFTDRPTGTTIKYSEATSGQIKEQLAEEFRDYRINKKIPQKPIDGRPFILKLFSDIVNMVKEWFGKENFSSLTEELFNKINTGGYKNNTAFETALSYASKGIIDIEDAYFTEADELSAVAITDIEKMEIVEEMTYLTLVDLVATDKGLFTLPTLNKTELYSKLKNEILETIANKVVAGYDLIESETLTKEQAKPTIDKYTSLMKLVDEQWESIVAKHEEYLKGYSIEFDENDTLQLTDENNTGRDNYQDATKIDNFKKTNAAIKLLLATMPKVYLDENSEEVAELSSIGGHKLIPMSETYVAIMNAVHTSRGLEEMFSRLRIMALNNPNYRTLYKRLTKTNWVDKGVNFTNIETTHGLQLISAFWKTFKKQNPSVQNVFILENGEVVVGDANLSTAAAQLKSEYIHSIILSAKEGKGFYKYDEAKKKYVGVPAKVKDIVLDSNEKRVLFLSKLGIPFTLKEINSFSKNLNKFQQFKTTVDGIKASIANTDEIAMFSGKVLEINNRLLELALLKASLTHPEFDSTYFNVTGDRTQSFIGTNATSDLYDVLSQIENLSELKGTQYAYLLTDAFAQGSDILKRMFRADGVRRTDINSEGLLKVGYVSGVINSVKGKQKQSSKLSYPERIVQGINLNLKGWFLNLIPADATIEWMINMGTPVTTSNLSKGMVGVNRIFGEYFKAELALARDKRPIDRHRDKKLAKELRFFKEILGEKLHNDIVAETVSIEDVYTKYENRINTALDKYINQKTNNLKWLLERFNILKQEETGWVAENIDLPENMTENELNGHLKALSINFIIANIEMHKILYSDPYQYWDELKRVKAFNSPAQPLVNDSKMNAAYNKVWNKGFKKGDIGYTDFTKSYFSTGTFADVIGIIDLADYKEFEETDGSGIISFSAYRNFRIRASEWNDNEEKQYRYDVAWEKRDKGFELTTEEIEILKKNPQVQSAYTPLKPIVRGNKANKRDYNDIVLDKFALYPLSYRMMQSVNKAGSKESSNAITLYNKMQNEKIDYMVFETGRKVGAEQLSPVYAANGDFVTTIYKGIVKVPFEILSIQAEVPSHDDNSVTRGSQITKLITMDYMEAGVPVDFNENEKNFSKRYKAWYALSEEAKKETSPLYKEIINNQMLLEELTQKGYENLLKRLGIKEENGTFTIVDLSKTGEMLRDEILKREVNDNISKALTSFLEGKSVLEATPAYQQIRNILYSIADKEVISQKMPGGSKVQIPSLFFEEKRLGLTKIAGKKGYTSDVLKFYTEGKDKTNVCEIMIGRWFESDMSDEALLEYLNNTPEGQKILSGLAYRIPTQKQNSIEAFVIKQFLPKEFGDSVVVPAALVAKTGSDFDIDKLFMYLKNVYQNAKGELKIVPYFGIGNEAKNKIAWLIQDEINEKIKLTEEKFVKTGDLQNLFGDISLGTSSNKTIEKWIPIFKEWFKNDLTDGKIPVSVVEDYFITRLEKLGKKLDLLTNEDVQEMLIDTQTDVLYKKSLENAFIESSENLVLHPKNYKRLIQPNSAKQLKDLAEEITIKTIGHKFDYANINNMLDIGFMTRLRHAFVTGKYAIGIAAVNQTNHSLNQRQPIFIDKEKLKLVKEDGHWLGDAEIKFDKFNKITVDGRVVPTLSMITNADGQDISDIIGQFIDGYVDISKGPWIMELGATPNVASTYLFLIKLGVPVDTVAYFMNQPIVQDYLRTIESEGYSWLFIDKYVKAVKGEYTSSITIPKDGYVIPSKNALKGMVGKKVENMNSSEMANQRLILDEFLKYAKMAEHMFLVTQGSNFDTATFNDPYLVFKKFKQLEKAQKTIISSIDKNGNVISGVDGLLNNSFIGTLKTRIESLRDALAEILKSDQPRVRGIIEKVITPYIQMNDNDFVKLAQKAVNDLFDFALQTNTALNEEIRDLLIKDGGAAKQVGTFIQYVKDHKGHPLHNNIVINLMQIVPSDKAGNASVTNVKVKSLANKVYDQNNLIFAFREIRDYLKGQDSKLYSRLVRLAILQSGLSKSTLSFTSVIPFEDFEEIYNETLSSLEKIPHLEQFFELGVFYRNNWNNDDIVPHIKAKYIKYPAGGGKYNPSMAFLPDNVKKATLAGDIPQTVTQSVLNREAKSDFIVYSWEDIILTQEDKKQGLSTTAKKKAYMRKTGDFSYIQKGLFQKVYDDFGTALIHRDYKGKEYFVYKATNAWGNGNKANEFYTEDRQSVIDNGFIKVESNPHDNHDIIDLFLAHAAKSTKQQPKPTYEINKPKQIDSGKKINIYAGSNENTELSNFAKRPFKLGDDTTYPTVEHAFQLEKLQYSNSYTDEQREVIVDDMNKKSASQVKAFGKTIKGLKVNEWNKDASMKMKMLVKESFKQNPQALQKLLATGNATLTHTQDNTKWKTEFPRILMEVREELSSPTNEINNVIAKKTEESKKCN